jgi:hypothetical protein
MSCRSYVFQGLLVFLFHSLASNGAFAAPAQPEIGDPIYSGTGCPGGSVGVVMSPDRRVVSLLFDQFTLEVDKAQPKRKRGKNPAVGEPVNTGKKCDLVLPIAVPQGMRARIATVELRGFHSLPTYSNAGILTAAGFYKDKKKDSDKKMTSWLMYKGPKEENFIATTKYPRDNLRDWTGCGRSDEMEILTNVYLSNQNTSEGAIFTIDSADIVSEGRVLKVELEWQSCR